jgi:hypothetical protein
MKKTTWSVLLRIPAEFLIVVISLVPLYLKITNKYPMVWPTAISLFIIGVSYFIGRFLSKKDSFDF